MFNWLLNEMKRRITISRVNYSASISRKCFVSHDVRWKWLKMLDCLPAAVQFRVAYDDVALDGRMDLSACCSHRYALVAFQLVQLLHYSHSAQMVCLSVIRSYLTHFLLGPNYYRFVGNFCPLHRSYTYFH